MSEFGKLRLSIEGTINGRGFDILYDFGAKRYFSYIQPWMQFPSRKYSDECKLVSIELVRRFNEFPELEARIKRLEAELNEKKINE